MNEPVTVVETQVFERNADECLSEEEREAFISFIAYEPDAGAIIQGTGGVRKVR